MTYKTIYDDVEIYAQTCEDEAIAQILEMANSPLGEKAHIRIMPDAHAGAGCVIGTTMHITDKVCPNIVGVDIGCGVDLIKTDIDFAVRLDELDRVIRKFIPYGQTAHASARHWDFEQLRCWKHLDDRTQQLAMHSLGTLGGGNHFIEAYKNGWLAVHSGSRNIGLKVAKYYQGLAEKAMQDENHRLINHALTEIPPQERENWLRANKPEAVNKALAYLTGQNLEDYLHDIKIMQQFALDNRAIMLQIITQQMHGSIIECICSIHNYIDTDNMILRKGAISAQKGEIIVIPLNMRDGMLICEGKGNPEWNYSAPHGAGRLYSRSQAKKMFDVDEYRETMQGIYSTCIGFDTLDEAPFVYKDWEEIADCITPTANIIERLIPIYNFKAND